MLDGVMVFRCMRLDNLYLGEGPCKQIDGKVTYGKNVVLVLF